MVSPSNRRLNLWLALGGDYRDVRPVSHHARHGVSRIIPARRHVQVAMTPSDPLMLLLHTETHLEMGRVLLDEREPGAGVTVTYFMTIEPEEGLTFHARSPHERGRAGMVTVTREVLRQRGLDGARPALAYLLRAAELGLLPRTTRLEPTPLVGVWSMDGERRDITLLD